ncbi:hypothetical protein SPRG_00869 [Saprolegnia parasitica CBS 223.65]|uniref:Uncharacterized protein n=1 Tax=Saprolegnia parasitica (strain CBS 223.65) TaxID=695850 RepID=A0A067CWD8_SAPPC|nr:hypothetical protein SPRG_00869 [Saprolegnia parasitica CBS 223.65]KDO34808.1 hypothetical protein SPRG_00869 [Saprolegnia parasitica CBS 223.65]|eukprot:XP_012194474.1 hypothetical protein SPRG_00869 [Saprolegnia parasitica CBS 223.65]
MNILGAGMQLDAGQAKKLVVCSACGGKPEPSSHMYVALDLCAVETCGAPQVRNYYCTQHIRSLELQPRKRYPVDFCFRCKRDALSVHAEGQSMVTFVVTEPDALLHLLAKPPPSTEVRMKRPSVFKMLPLRKSSAVKRPVGRPRGRPRQVASFHPFGSNPTRSADASVPIGGADDDASVASPDFDDAFDEPDAVETNVAAEMIEDVAAEMTPEESLVPTQQTMESELRTSDVVRPPAKQVDGAQDISPITKVMASKRLCSMAECTLAAKSRGLCMKHYYYEAKHRQCQRSGCKHIAKTDGLCRSHFNGYNVD